MAENENKSEYRWWEDTDKLGKLEQAFAIGCTDKEACSFAEISPDQLYYYTRVIDPEFQVKKERLKDKPILNAKQTVVNNLEDKETAKWYLERKCSSEFSAKHINEYQGKLEVIEGRSQLEELAEDLDQYNRRSYEINRTTESLPGSEQDHPVVEGV